MHLENLQKPVQLSLFLTLKGLMKFLNRTINFSMIISEFKSAIATPTLQLDTSSLRMEEFFQNLKKDCPVSRDSLQKYKSTLEHSWFQN